MEPNDWKVEPMSDGAMWEPAVRPFDDDDPIRTTRDIDKCHYARPFPAPREDGDVMTHATAHVEAIADDVRYHCSHTEGRSSYRLTGDHDVVTVYLAGTPAEIMRFAEALQHAAEAQHDIELADLG